ncbi:hypothetical protein BDP27DRAFT_1331480 [Rhodocollybia butyracea]|uniref:Uncharacterized protein n=1 Tax=Rhodocollybia butyracea TaxID=206335 RepID=A0A9P5PPZ1_9AGAR|nr:hypothetical protein BDP27DRAFT_1331480 [Rhodocollybia butyracea]
MRRAQSVRHHSRASLSALSSTTSNSNQFGTAGGQLALHADDLGVLREGDESDADVLRKQLLEKDRECDRLKTTLSILQSQLSVRPPVEHVQALEREYKDQELLLQGTQRENERCMAEMERMKIREKMLERELARLAGDNWQASLDISPAPAATIGTLGSRMHQRSNTTSSTSGSTSNSGSFGSSLNPTLNPTINTSNATSAAILSTDGFTASPIQDQNSSPTTDPAAVATQIDKIRLLILGMETRLSKREEHLQEIVNRAEEEGRRWKEVGQA